MSQGRERNRLWGSYSGYFLLNKWMLTDSPTETKWLIFSSITFLYSFIYDISSGAHFYWTKSTAISLKPTGSYSGYSGPGCLNPNQVQRQWLRMTALGKVSCISNESSNPLTFITPADQDPNSGWLHILGFFMVESN